MVYNMWGIVLAFSFILAAIVAVIFAFRHKPVMTVFSVSPSQIKRYVGESVENQRENSPVFSDMTMLAVVKSGIELMEKEEYIMVGEEVFDV